MFNQTQKQLCAYNQQTTSSKVLTIPHQQSICRRRHSKWTYITLAEISRGISFSPLSNNTLSSPTSRAGSKIKAGTEEKSNRGLPAGIVDYSYFFSLVIDDDFKMGDMSG